MFLSNPPDTKYDWKFRLLNIPVRVHPFFWLACLLLCMGALRTDNPGIVNALILASWTFCLFVSIMVHEYGHALTGRKYGSKSVRVVLYAFGGLAINANGRNRKQRIWILLNGPFAGFILGGIFLAIDYSIPKVDGGVQVSNNGYLDYFITLVISNMIWINMLWGMLNLVPIYPLDGGQVFYEVMQGKNPRKATYLTHKVSIITCVILGIIAIATGYSFGLIMLALLGFENYQAMQRGHYY